MRTSNATSASIPWRSSGRRAYSLLLGLALVLACQVPATAQEPSPSAPPTTPILVLQNLAPFAREELAAVVVPFAIGTVTELPDLHVPDIATAWEAFGARWPDGSLRQALCLFRTRLNALEQRRIPLQPGRGPELPTGAITAPAATLTLVLQQGERQFRAEPQFVADLEHNPLRRVELRRARLGDSGLLVELLLTAARDQDHAYVDVAAFHSDPRSRAMSCAIDELRLECRGMALWLRHAGRFGIRQALADGGSNHILLQQTSLGDGQGIRRCGALLPIPAANTQPPATTNAASLLPIYGACDWRASDAFGAFGQPAALPDWLRGSGLREHLAHRHRRFVDSDRNGDPFAAGPLGLAKNAGQTGDQHDFGAVKLSLVAHSGLPSLLFEAEASVLQEACRPVHFYEADGQPVEPDQHPDWVVWSGRTHWHPEQSKDRLGKPVPEPPFEAHGWTGKDREHWSSNYLGAFALLTGAHWARLELANEARLYRAGQTLDPRYATSNSGPPRAAGRTQLAATWMYLATGDEALRRRIDDRLDQIEYMQWRGRTLPADHVRPFAVAGRDARMLGGQTDYWTPWQDGLAVLGFAAVHRTTGNPRARELAEHLARNLVTHGWKLDARECLVATAMRWQDGRPLTDQERNDPAAVLWSYGTGFSEWAAGACEIARITALRDGDTLLATRAQTIQQHLRTNRRRPPDNLPELGGIDRLSEWEAVQWK